MSIDSLSPKHKVYANKDVELLKLVLMSDRFYNAAKSIVATIITDQRELQRYYKLIKLSIKSLKATLAKYALLLHPILKCLVYYKLSCLFFREVKDLRTAESYCTKCLNLARRNDLEKYTIMALVLQIEVLKESDITYAKLLFAHLVENTHTPIESCITFVYRHQLFGDLHSIYKSQNFSESLERCPEPLKTYIRLLCSCEALALGDKLAFSMFYAGLVVESQPAQIISMYHLIGLVTSLLLGDMMGFRQSAKALDGLISENRKQGWDTWDSNGLYNVEVSLSSGESLKLQLHWLNAIEFTSFYKLVLCLGLVNQGLVTKVTGPLESAGKILEAFNEIIEGKSAISASYENFKRRFVACSNIYYNIAFYKNWINVAHLSNPSESSATPLVLPFVLENVKNPEVLALLDEVLVTNENKFNYLTSFIQLHNRDYENGLVGMNSIEASTSPSSDINMYSKIQELMMSFALDDEESPRFKDYMHQDLKNILENGVLSSNSDMRALVQLNNCLEEINYKSHTSKFEESLAYLQELDGDTLAMPFLKVVVNIFCIFHETSMERVDKRAEYCSKVLKRVVGYSDIVLKISFYQTLLNLHQKRSSPSILIEEIKLKLASLEKSIELK